MTEQETHLLDLFRSGRVGVSRFFSWGRASAYLGT